MPEKEIQETIIVNPKEESKDTTFPSLDLAKFEKQMKAYNSYSALQKFRNETGISPAFDLNTLGAYTSGNLLDLQNYGTSKFSVDYTGKITCVGLEAGTGSVSGTGGDMGSEKITNVKDPTTDQDAATKKYVDDNGGVSTDTDLEQRTEGDGSGDKTITHSLGKTPSLIIIKANLEGGLGDVQDAWSYGYIKAVGSEKCVSFSQYEGGNYKTGQCIWVREAQNDYWEGDVKSIDSDEFVITFTKSGSPNACTFIWWAIA